jgi:transglutaminase-like putative cysteine protease
MQFLPENQLQNTRYKRRVVYVKSSHYLGHVLPVDGKVVWLQGNFFSRQISESAHGAIEPDVMWTTANNVFTNYIDVMPTPAPLSQSARQELTYYPSQSEALTEFVREKTSPATNLVHKARLLEKYLSTHYTYELGTPELNRLQPVDDFVFKRKSGHCERFAATLALMLRMEGIPSRVVVGYVPTSRNLFNGRAQVRFADAHSWTEGYFDGVGWVTFDATPGPTNSRGSDLRDLFDALDFAWYSNIVNFNGVAQHQLLATSRQILGHISKPVWSGAASLSLLIVLILCAIRFGTFPSLRLRRLSRFIHKSAPESQARHRYEEMLRLLEKRGLKKKAEETPLEFLKALGSKPATGQKEVAVITESFCETCYGEKPISISQEGHLKEAFERLKTESAPA